MGSVSGALASVDWVAGFGPDVAVPGHGPVLTGSDIDRVLDEHRRYRRFASVRARAGLELAGVRWGQPRTPTRRPGLVTSMPAEYDGSGGHAQRIVGRARYLP